MHRDRIALFVAYVLLVGVVAWTTFDIRRTLDDVRNDVCATAEIVVANELTNLIIAADEGESVEITEPWLPQPAEFADLSVAIQDYLDLSERLQERCGERVISILGVEP